MNNAVTEVSVIGLGLMGTALAEAFLRNQKTVTVWNRTLEKSKALAQSGAKVAQSLLEAIEASSVIIVCVLNYSVSRTLFQEPSVAIALKGKVLVQLSTGIPREAKESQSWAQQHDITYIDGAILSHPKGIGAPECTILYAGPESAFGDQRSLLLSLGGNPVFTGEAIGNACALDGSILSFYYGFNLAFLHGAALSESEGIPLAIYLATLLPVMPVLIESMKESVERISRNSYEASKATMTTHFAALNHIHQLTRETGVDLPYIECVLEYVHRAIGNGYGENDLLSLFKLLKKQRSQT